MAQVMPYDGDEPKPKAQDFVPVKSSGKTSVNGLHLLEGETVIWTGQAQVNAVKQRLGCWDSFVESLAACCCACIRTTRDIEKHYAELMLTDKRFVLMMKTSKQKPGEKLCCFWMQCCCMCPQRTELVETEKQHTFQIPDVKDYELEIVKRDLKSDCCMACCTQDTSEITMFSLKMFVTKRVGDFMPSWVSFSTDNKTSWTVQEITGFIERPVAGDIRRHLDAVVANNANKQLAAVQGTNLQLTNAF